MKDIKFKVWDRQLKQMCVVDSIEFIDELEGRPGVNAFARDGKIAYWIEKENAVLLQYTGLLDKNGKEIYEGDILKIETDKPMAVGWSNKFASFILNKDGWAFSHWFGESCNPKDCEVIGNTYQNPDLIK